MLIDRVYNSVYRRCKQIRSEKKRNSSEDSILWFYDSIYPGSIK